jgi:hypothetical protein
MSMSPRINSKQPTMMIPTVMNMITAVKRKAVERMKNKMSSLILLLCEVGMCVLLWSGGLVWWRRGDLDWDLWEKIEMVLN